AAPQTARPPGSRTQYARPSSIGGWGCAPRASNTYPAAGDTTAAARNNQFLGPKCRRERARLWSGIMPTVYAPISSSSSSWTVRLRHRPPFVQQGLPLPIAPPAHPDEPHEHEPRGRPEGARRHGPRHPPVPLRHVPLPARLEVVLRHVIRGPQRRIERRLARQAGDQQPEPTSAAAAAPA